MRILTAGNLYPPHHQGGYEQDWMAAVQALHEAGHEVRVLASDHRESGVTAPDHPGVFRELRSYWRGHTFPATPYRVRWAIERHNQAVLARHLRSFHPQLVSWWSMGGMSLGLLETVRRAKIPAVGIVYDDWLIYGPEVDGWQHMWGGPRWLARLASALTGLPTKLELETSAHWLFCSESARVASRTVVSAFEDSDLLPPGLDELFLTPQPEREWGWRLLLPGRLDPRKGVMSSVEALTYLPAEATLTIVGRGDDRFAQELRDRARELGVADRVNLGPPQSREALLSSYAASDVVLFPVLWPEPFGLVPLEAMGVGRPVVATGQGGSREYLRDGENCLLFPPGDAAGQADAIRRLAGSPDIRERLRAGGLATAPRYARSRWNVSIVEEHERAVRARPGRSARPDEAEHHSTEAAADRSRPIR